MYRRFDLQVQVVMESKFMAPCNGLLYTFILPHGPHCIANLEIGEGFVGPYIWIRIV